MRTIIAVLFMLAAVPADAATEWRVKSYQGSQVRNTASETVAVGTRCAAYVWSYLGNASPY